MLKKIAIPTLAAIAMFGIVGAAPAKAAVHFGVQIGGPVYSYPAPVYQAPAPDPYAYSYPDYGYATPYYSAPVYPYGGYYRDGDHDRDDRGRFEPRDRDDHGLGGHYRDDFRGHEGHRR